MDAIDLLVELALALVAAVLAGVLLLRSRRVRTATVSGRTAHRPAAWALASLLVGVVLVLRVGVEVVPADWQAAVIAATLLSAAAGVVVSSVAIARSRRP